MSALYTRVSEDGKNDVIVVNRNFTEEELREKISVATGCDQDWLDYIINNGIRIPEGKYKVIRIWHDKTIIKTENRYSTWYCHKWYKLILYPDASFRRVYPIWYWWGDQIEEFKEKIKKYFSTPGDRKERER